MDKEILELLKSMNEKIDNLSEGQKRIETKLDNVVDQTADLTEFRTETKDTQKEILSEIKAIRNDLNTVEMITSKNWNEIAHLKAVK